MSLQQQQFDSEISIISSENNTNTISSSSPLGSTSTSAFAINILGISTAKLLSDKTYEKRKTAATEVEKITRELLHANDIFSITALINLFSIEYCLSIHSHSRNGGLIGLAAIAIALGKEGCMKEVNKSTEYKNNTLKKIEENKEMEEEQEPQQNDKEESNQREKVYLLDLIVGPVISCFTDQDSRVRYYACEGLYNICKVARTSILRWFGEIFDALSKLASDTELSVKNGSELLDRLIKDILNEDISGESRETTATATTNASAFPFNLLDSSFIPILTVRLPVKAPTTRIFLLSWINLFLFLPQFDFILRIPKVLPQIFSYVEDFSSSASDVKLAALDTLNNFLEEIKARINSYSASASASSSVALALPNETITAAATTCTLLGKGFLAEICGLLQPFLTSPSLNESKAVAFTWIKDLFVLDFKNELIDFLPALIDAILSSCSLLTSTTWSLMTKRGSVEEFEDPILQCNSTLQKSIMERSSSSTFTAKDKNSGSVTNNFKLSAATGEAALKVLSCHILSGVEETRIKSLDWLLILQKVLLGSGGFLLLSNSMDDAIFHSVLTTLADASNEVIRRDLAFLAQIASSLQDNTIIKRFISALIKFFKAQRSVLESRGGLILRQLCISLSSEKVYLIFAEELLEEERLEFTSLLVLNLNHILLTSPETGDLRKKLRKLKDFDLFIALFKSWSHHTVSALTLCLLVQCYELSFLIVETFADIEARFSTLIQLDKLVQLLESPIFIYLRLQLLDQEEHPFLLKTLFGILMVLPQSNAFVSLRNRLNAVSTPKGTQLSGVSGHFGKIKRPFQAPQNTALRIMDEAKIRELFQHFNNIQMKHELMAYSGEAISQSHSTSSSLKKKSSSGAKRHLVSSGGLNGSSGSTKANLNSGSSNTNINSSGRSFSSISASSVPTNDSFTGGDPLTASTGGGVSRSGSKKLSFFNK